LSIVIIVIIIIVFSVLARVRWSPLIPIVQSKRSCASSPHNLTSFMSSSTHCIQVFLLHFWLSTARFLHLDTQSLESLRCKCLYHRSLSRRTTSSTPSTLKRFSNTTLDFILILIFSGLIGVS